MHPLRSLHELVSHAAVAHRHQEGVHAKKLDDLMADLCMGCGTCSFVCPAKQPLAQTSKLARDFMRAEMARRG